jgi:hypothetical protein
MLTTQLVDSHPGCSDHGAAELQRKSAADPLQNFAAARSIKPCRLRFIEQNQAVPAVQSGQLNLRARLSLLIFCRCSDAVAGDPTVS